MPLSITIKRRLPSQNETSNKRGLGAQFAYKKERDVWYILIRTFLVPRVNAPTERVSVKITSYRNRLLDFGNLVGGAKPIPDCLIRLNYLKDDNPKWAAITYEQHQVPLTEERTVIEIGEP